MSEFNLPPPWDPRYALPQNVEDEGLERHGYVTQWAQRGSFDNPRVGTAGYAVPEYVVEETYGRGAMSTKWAPRGSYAGPKVKHWLDNPSARVVGAQRLPGGATQVDIETMAGIEMSATGDAAYSAYGQRVARMLLGSVSVFPDSDRKRMLKAMMDRIDPTLYNRAEAAAQPELKVGVPPAIALERGIAFAASHGMATELVNLGKGKKPAKKSQLGMLGLDLVMATQVSSALPQKGECSTSGMIWDLAADGTGYWRARKAGEVCLTQGTQAGPTVRTGTTTTPVLPPAEPQSNLVMQIGPFYFPLAAQRVSYHALNDDQNKFIADNMLTAFAAGGGAGDLASRLKNGQYPIAKFTRPVRALDPQSGKVYGLYYTESSTGSELTYKEYVAGDGIFTAIWKGIKSVVSAIVNVVKDVVDAVKDVACDLFSGSAGQLAGAAAGAAVGGPAGAQAGAMGAQVAAKACATPIPTCPTGQFYDPSSKACVVLPPPASSSLMPLLLIGGVGVAAILLLGKKRSS